MRLGGEYLDTLVYQAAGDRRTVESGGYHARPDFAAAS
jgi:hypothetical protein